MVGHLPLRVQRAVAWATAVGLIGLVLLGAVLLLAQVYVVVWALVGAMMIRALLDPVITRARNLVPWRLASAALVFVGFLAVVAGALALVGRQVAEQFDELGTQLSEGLESTRDWLSDTFSVSADDLASMAEQVRDAVQGNAGGLAGSLSSAAGTAGEIVAGVLLALFLAFFFLADGRQIWAWVVGLFPASARAEVDPAGLRAWQALVSYMKGIVVVALADAALIAIALAVLGVPLVLALATLTFLGAFIPLIGATLAGVAAALVALVAVGPGTALIVVGVVIAIQWVDSDLLQPIILSRAVNLHPVAVALSITTGSLLAGLGGAVAATPFVAMVYAMVRPQPGSDAGPS